MDKTGNTAAPDEAVLRENLRAFRRKARISVRRISDYLGVTPGEYAAYEDGRKDISTSELESVAYLLAVEPFAFFVKGSAETYEPRLLLSGLPVQDLRGMARFNRVVANYEMMTRISNS